MAELHTIADASLLLPLPNTCRPFESWGADAVIAGHDHHYERLANPNSLTGRSGFPYIVNGLGEWRPGLLCAVLCCRLQMHVASGCLDSRHPRQ